MKNHPAERFIEKDPDSLLWSSEPVTNDEKKTAVDMFINLVKKS